MELTGEGDDVCVIYWVLGLANEHSLVDTNGEWGPEDANPWRGADFLFCLDSGMAVDDCGPIYGPCCTCPTTPPGEGICEEGVLRTDCVDAGGLWLVGTHCDADPCPGTPANDECANAESVPSLAAGDVTVEFDNRCATDDDPYLDTDCATSGDLHYDVWFAYTAEAPGELTISSCGLVYWDQMIAVYDVTEPGKDCANLTEDDEVICGDDDCGVGGGPSEVTFTVATGQELLIRVGGWDTVDNTGDPRGDGSVRFSFSLAPPDTPPWPHDARKNRYVSFAPNGPDLAAYQVEMTASGYFPDSAGVLGWVGAPDENGITRLVDEPFLSDTWPAVVHVGDCVIVPAATYEIRATFDGATFSDPLEVSTIAPPVPKYWADVVGEFGGTEWGAPNRVVNMDDVMAAVQYFKQEPTAPPLTWLDVDAEVPNAVLNFSDIQQIVNGFKGEPYPFSAPAECP